MSLISEALKKARGEKPGPYPVALPPPRRTLTPWLLAAVSLGVTAGLLIGVLVRRDSAANEAAAAADVAAAGPVTPVEAAPAATDVEPPVAGGSRPPAAEREAEIGQAGAAGSTSPATPTPSERHESPRAPPAVDEESLAMPAPAPEPAPALETPPFPTPAPAQAAAVAPPQEGTPTAGATYFRQVTLPGGVDLTLGGIAWSENNPAALVNSRVLGPGEGGEDWTITAVERGRVEIEWQGVRFFLRLN